MIAKNAVLTYIDCKKNNLECIQMFNDQGFCADFFLINYDFFSVRDENQQLTEDYKRITEQFRDLQRKSR